MPHPREETAGNLSSDDATLEKCLERNKTWADNIVQTGVLPNLFKNATKGQHPRIIWFGCCDSRVPETSLLDLLPGDVFVHRNIANNILNEDDSSQAAFTYALGHIHTLEHIIVCGHTKCGGVGGALADTLVTGNVKDADVEKLDVVTRWLLPLIKIRKNQEGIEGWDSKTEDQKMQIVIEENIKQGVDVAQRAVQKVFNEAPTSELKEHLKSVKVHGLCYDIANGTLKAVETVEELDAWTARRT
ncbi:MAG: hypothetical protein M1837_004228 [Sclerophora amabilis]|nr:MAG: hypothetical protein M1837_004228 [Sclerophora amabilis]